MARLREHPLAPLPIDDPNYAEFVVYSAMPTPDVTMEWVREWASRRDEVP
ncbi:hypothetical protein [Streptomyces sp. NPDC017993]